jgi:hypothetical protein
VVTPQEEDVFGVFQFVAEEKFNSFNRVVASVHEIPDKDVPGAWQLSSYFEQLQHVEKLTVNVPADSNWGLRFVDVALLEQQLFDFVAEGPN